MIEKRIRIVSTLDMGARLKHSCQKKVVPRVQEVGNSNPYNYFYWRQYQVALEMRFEQLTSVHSGRTSESASHSTKKITNISNAVLSTLKYVAGHHILSVCRFS